MNLPHCMGIPVVHDERQKAISDTRGLGRWRKIVVGPSFFAFPPREQQAIMLHEVAHCKMKHLEQRIKSLWLLLWKPSRLKELCIAQEHQADAFVRGCGYGADLARAFGRLRSEKSLLHPPVDERIVRLTSQF